MPMKKIKEASLYQMKILKNKLTIVLNLTKISVITIVSLQL